MRLAQTDALRYLGDPDHLNLPLEALLEKSYSHQRAQHITMDRCVCARLLVPVCTSHALLTLDSSVDFIAPPLTSMPPLFLLHFLLCVCVFFDLSVHLLAGTVDFELWGFISCKTNRQTEYKSIKQHNDPFGHMHRNTHS